MLGVSNSPTFIFVRNLLNSNNTLINILSLKRDITELTIWINFVFNFNCWLISLNSARLVPASTTTSLDILGIGGGSSYYTKIVRIGVNQRLMGGSMKGKLVCWRRSGMWILHCCVSSNTGVRSLIIDIIIWIRLRKSEISGHLSSNHLRMATSVHEIFRLFTVNSAPNRFVTGSLLALNLGLLNKLPQKIFLIRSCRYTTVLAYGRRNTNDPRLSWM